MHELAVTESIMQVALEHAEKADADSITDIYLVVGDLSSIVDDSVQFYFDFLSQGTLAEGARLHFERVRARLACNACGHEYDMQDAEWKCPRCGAAGGKVIAGKEFYLRSIEVTRQSGQ